MSEVVGQIVAAVLSVTGGPSTLHAPYIVETDSWNGSRTAGLSPVGYDQIQAFEQKLKQITGARHAVALSSGTAAIHMALVAAGVKPGDEVLMPALTFVASANAVCHAGAIPHFIDVHEPTLGVNPFKLRQYLKSIAQQIDINGGWVANIVTGRRIAALMPVHLYGNPCQIDELATIARDWNIPIVEDAAEALGSFFGRTHCGLFGKVGCFSFNNNKTVTTGGGGAIITDSEQIAVRVNYLATTAKTPHPWRWDHTEVAWNYRMPNVCAALGVGQLGRIGEIREHKRAVALRYANAFAGLEEIATVHPESDGVTRNGWLTTILIDPRHVAETEPVLAALHAVGVNARAGFTPMHLLPMFRDFPKQNLLVAEDLARRLICLPSGSNIKGSPP